MSASHPRTGLRMELGTCFSFVQICPWRYVKFTTHSVSKIFKWVLIWKLLIMCECVYPSSSIFKFLRFPGPGPSLAGGSLFPRVYLFSHIRRQMCAQPGAGHWVFTKTQNIDRRLNERGSPKVDFYRFSWIEWISGVTSCFLFTTKLDSDEGYPKTNKLQQILNFLISCTAM